MVRGWQGRPHGTAQRGRLVVAGAVLVLWLGAGAAAAADAETRDFTVLVDGKKAGAVHMTINRQDDDSIAFSCDTDVRVGALIPLYTYSYRGKELWKDGRLQRFESKCNDDGKAEAVAAIAAADGLHVRVNGAEHVVSADAWLSSYWAQPDAKLNGRTVPIIDADCGRDLAAQVDFVGAERASPGGQDQTVQHVRLTGKNVGIDLWYDESGRLVRQEWVEDDHRTQIVLSGVRH